MASYLRPRRGSLANAKAQLTASNPLKSGEVFFECENIGKSQGKIKLGDATTTYSSLPYFLSMQDSSIGFTDVTSSVSTAESTLLGNIKPSTAHSTVIQNIKQLLWNHTQKITALDANKVPTSRTVNSKALSANISLTAADVGAVPTSRTINSKALSANITLSASDVGAYTKTEIDNKELKFDTMTGTASTASGSGWDDFPYYCNAVNTFPSERTVKMWSLVSIAGVGVILGSYSINSNGYDISVYSKVNQDITITIRYAYV